MIIDGIWGFGDFVIFKSPNHEIAKSRNEKKRAPKSARMRCEYQEGLQMPVQALWFEHQAPELVLWKSSQSEIIFVRTSGKVGLIISVSRTLHAPAVSFDL